jgi:hypothetical protein
MAREQSSKNTSGSFFPTLFNRTNTVGDIQIWLRCFRIAGSLTERTFTNGK